MVTGLLHLLRQQIYKYEENSQSHDETHAAQFSFWIIKVFIFEERFNSMIIIMHSIWQHFMVLFLSFFLYTCTFIEQIFRISMFILPWQCVCQVIFSTSQGAYTYLTKNCDLLNVWFFYSSFPPKISCKFHLWHKSSVSDEGDEVWTKVILEILTITQFHTQLTHVYRHFLPKNK